MKLILLPGMDGTGLLFKPFLDELPNTIDAQVMTLKPLDEQGYEAQLAWVEKQLPEEGDLVLLAESFSGPLALLIARKFSGRVKACVFVASFLSCPHNGLKWLGALLPLRLLVHLPLSDFMIGRYLLGGSASAEQYGLFRKAVKCVDKSVLRARLRVISDLRSTDKRPLRMPCFYLEALDDRLLNEACLESFYEVFGRVSQRRISGPHLLLQSRSEECALIVSGLISSLCEAD